MCASIAPWTYSALKSTCDIHISHMLFLSFLLADSFVLDHLLAIIPSSAVYITNTGEGDTLITSRKQFLWGPGRGYNGFEPDQTTGFENVSGVPVLCDVESGTMI